MRVTRVPTKLLNALAIAAAATASSLSAAARGVRILRTNAVGASIYDLAGNLTRSDHDRPCRTASARRRARAVRSSGSCGRPHRGVLHSCTTPPLIVWGSGEARTAANRRLGDARSGCCPLDHDRGLTRTSSWNTKTEPGTASPAPPRFRCGRVTAPWAVGWPAHPPGCSRGASTRTGGSCRPSRSAPCPRTARRCSRRDP